MGRPAHRSGGPECLDAIVYVLRTGCTWRHLPHDFTVSWSSAHKHFLRWCGNGVWAANPYRGPRRGFAPHPGGANRPPQPSLIPCRSKPRRWPRRKQPSQWRWCTGQYPATGHRPTTTLGGRTH
ncbi:transposase [Mycolicibacterium boenickei]|nr:transposase [Mycolicibacterium boenickei]